jgi:hypothetical protein
MSNKKYIGDGCYAEWDGFGINLTTENGRDVTNRIYLEPEVLQALIAFNNSIRAKRADIQTSEMFPEGDG